MDFWFRSGSMSLNILSFIGNLKDVVLLYYFYIVKNQKRKILLKLTVQRKVDRV